MKQEGPQFKSPIWVGINLMNAAARVEPATMLWMLCREQCSLNIHNINSAESLTLLKMRR